jgi:glycosyltransferase involved in cell wall biosynthesis
MSTPSISIIIPVLRDDALLSGLLDRLVPFRVHEIIIADGEQREALPLKIIPNGMSPTHLSCRPGRGPQIKAGLSKAKSDYVWILHADSRPHSESLHFIRETLKIPAHSLAIFSLRFDTPSLLLRLYSWLAKWESPLSTFGDQGFALRRTDYECLSLDLDHYPLLEDVALRQALKRRGRVIRSPLPIMTSARRFQKHGIIKTQLFNFQILCRYFLGQSPASLYKLYYK